MSPVDSRLRQPRIGRWRQPVLIVDDHGPFRAMARRMLRAHGYQVVGEAQDGASAVAASSRQQPSVVLLDVQLPDIDGFAVAETLVASDDPPAVVLISSRAASSYRRRLAESPARGFLAKSE